MLRWLADLLVPVLVLSRHGYYLGWVGRTKGHRYAHIERLFMRPRARGVKNLWLKFQLNDRWFAQCRRRGITLVITRIRSNRLQLLQTVEQVGYRRYHADPLLTHLSFRLDNPASQAIYDRQRTLAKGVYDNARAHPSAHPTQEA